MSCSPNNENPKNIIGNNSDKRFNNGKNQYDSIKSCNYISKNYTNILQESYYNGNDWRYPHINYPQNLPNNYSSATYYFNNNAYQCVPSYIYYNCPYSNDVSYIYYPVNHFQYNNKHYRGSNNYRYNNSRNFRKPRAGKQYVYNIKNDFYFNEGEFIDDNITDMQKMKEIENLDDDISKEHYNYRDFCNSPTNEELCESTSMLLDRVAERAKGYLNLYNSNYDNIQP